MSKNEPISVTQGSMSMQDFAKISAKLADRELRNKQRRRFAEKRVPRRRCYYLTCEFKSLLRANKSGNISTDKLEEYKALLSNNYETKSKNAISSSDYVEILNLSNGDLSLYLICNDNDEKLKHIKSIGENKPFADALVGRQLGEIFEFDGVGYQIIGIPISE